MNGKTKTTVSIALIGAMLVVGVQRLVPTLEHIGSNAFSTLGLLLVLGLLSFGVWRVLRD